MWLEIGLVYDVVAVQYFSSHIQDTRCGGFFYPSAEVQSVYSTAPANWALAHRCCILRLQFWFLFFIPWIWQENECLFDDVDVRISLLMKKYSVSLCILEATPYKTATVWPLTSYLTNHPSKMNKTCRALLEK